MTPPPPADDAHANRAAGPPVRSWSGAWRSRVDGVVLAAVITVFGVVAGLPGLAVGVGLALVWFVLPAPAVFTAGIVAVSALVPGGAARLETALPTVALAGVLSTTTVSDERRRDIAAFLVVWAGLAVATLAVRAVSDALWVAAVAVVALGGLGFIAVAAFGLKQAEEFDDE